MIDGMRLEDLLHLEDLRLVLSDYADACGLRVNLYDRLRRAAIEGFPDGAFLPPGPTDEPVTDSSDPLDRMRSARTAADPLFPELSDAIDAREARSRLVDSPAGLLSFLVPVRTGDEIIGTLAAEPCAPDRDALDRFEARAAESGLPAARARALRDGVRVMSRSALRARMRLLESAVLNLVRSRVASGELAEVNHLLRENDTLRQRAEAKLRTLSTLFQIAKATNSSLELKKVLERIIEAVTRLLKVEVCSVMRHDPAEGVLRIMAAIGLDPQVVREARVKVGEGISGHVAKFRESLLIADIARDPRFAVNTTKAEYRTRSALSVPMLAGDDLIGVLNVNNKASGEIFSAEDKELLEAIADQTAVAVMNARRHFDLERKLKEVESLHAVSRAMQSTLDLDKILKVSLDVISDLMGVETCSLMLVNEGEGTMSIVIANGLDPEIVRSAVIRVGEGISGRVAATGEPLLIANVDEDPSFEARHRAEYRTRSALSAPLKVKDRVIGVINVNNKKSGEIFRPADLMVLETLSNQIAAAIENARLFHRNEQKIVELTTLQRVGQTINSTLDLSSVLGHVLDQIIAIFEADMGSIMLWDEREECLRIMEQRGLDPGYAEQIRFGAGEGVAGLVFQLGRGTLIADSSKDPHYKKFGGAVEARAKTLLCVPVFIKGRPVGVLSCERTLDHTGPFSVENLDLMTTISTQASVAIENANLYNDLLNLYLHTIQSLAAAIDAKDSYTHGHSRRVMKYAVAIAREMGLDETELHTLRHTALLHDIGKIGISESILQKPGKLTDEEFHFIQGHPVMGAHILESIEFLREVRMQMKHHHEKFDGKGYPDGLKGDQIPRGARIISVADTYDAMTSTRPYRKGLAHEVALEEIKRCSGTQFDPAVVDAFVRVSAQVAQLNADDQAEEDLLRLNPNQIRFGYLKNGN